MGWPTGHDFRESIQNPDRCFVDPRLRRSAAEKNKMGLPKTRSGQFANVYKMIEGKANFAVRVFLWPSDDREDRYRAIHAHINGHPAGHSSGRPECIVDFAYNPQGIRVGAELYPLQTMEWVDGVTLGTWIRKAVERRDNVALRRMADRWVALVEELQKNQIAHGDLQHGNVMVKGDNPVLVDYDGMCVPGLEGKPTTERGLPAYQHPERGLQSMSLELDHFSAWIILIALRALASDLNLWRVYVELPENENILFAEADIYNPDASRLWADLLASQDPDVPRWAEALRDSIKRPFEEIPRFEMDPFGPIRPAVAARDWDKIWTIAGSPALAGKSPPPDLAATIKEAGERVACRDRVRTALSKADFKGAVAAYQPALLDDWPAAKALVDEVRRAAVVAPVLEELELALKVPGDGRKLVALWTKNAKTLAGVAAAKPIQAAVEQWSHRIDLSEKLGKAVQADNNESQMVDLWNQLQDAGGHPDSDRHRARVDSAKVRAKALDVLAPLAAATPRTDDVDDRLVREWARHDATLKGCVQAAALRSRRDEAAVRLVVLKEWDDVIAKAETGRASLDQLDRVGAKLPKRYSPRREARVMDLVAKLEAAEHERREKLQAEENLRRALEGLAQLDVAIANAYDRAVAAGVPPLDDEVKERCELAVRRRARLRDLEKLGDGPPDYHRDLAWERTWDEDLDGCHDAASLRVRYSKAMERLRTWRDLENELALDEVDVQKVRDLARSPVLTGYPPLLARMNEINKLIEFYERKEELLTALAGGIDNVEDLLVRVMADPGLWSKITAVLGEEGRAAIERWVTEKVLSQIRPRDPSFLREIDGTVVVRWEFPKSRLVQICRVALDPAAFFKDPSETEGRRGTHEVDRTGGYQRTGGLRFSPERHWSRVYATIWPLVNLGWITLSGRPLQLGPFPLGGGAARAAAPPPAQGSVWRLLKKL
jgi:hypothetical protein